jgi:hypothetical protein
MEWSWEVEDIREIPRSIWLDAVAADPTLHPRDGDVLYYVENDQLTKFEIEVMFYESAREDTTEH